MIDETTPNLEHEAHQELRRKKLVDIEFLPHAHVEVETRADLAKVVEGPLLSSAQALFDKNVQTYISSANRKNAIHGMVDFSIIYEGLSEANKAIAAQMIEEQLAELFPAIPGNVSRLNFDIPASTESTWGEIEDEAETIARRFAQQRLMPVGYTGNYLVNFLLGAVERDFPEGGDIPPDYFERHDYFYEPQSGLFIHGMENYRRATEPVEGVDPDEPPQFSLIEE